MQYRIAVRHAALNAASDAMKPNIYRCFTVGLLLGAGCCCPASLAVCSSSFIKDGDGKLKRVVSENSGERKNVETRSSPAGRLPLDLQGGCHWTYRIVSETALGVNKGLLL